MHDEALDKYSSVGGSYGGDSSKSVSWQIYHITVDSIISAHGDHPAINDLIRPPKVDAAKHVLLDDAACSALLFVPVDLNGIERGWMFVN